MCQCPGLKEDDFIVIEVPELMIGLNGPPGYICMCKTRAGNAKFYTWFFETIVIPTLVDNRNQSKTEAFPILYTMDGEQKVLDSVFNGITEDSIRLIAKLKAERIFVVKIPASTSGVLQAADVGPIFRLLKLYLKRISNNSDWLNRIPAESYNACINAIKRVQDIPGFIRPTRDFGTAMKRLAQGVVLLWACLETALTPLNIMKGFLWSSQSKVGDTFDYEHMMKKLRSTEFDKTVFAQWESSVDLHAAYIVLNGNLAESAMTECGLPATVDDPCSQAHDCRYIYKQRAVWLNHPRILAFIKAQNTENYSYAEVAATHPYNFVVAAPVTPGILPDQLVGGGTLPAPLDNAALVPSKRKNGDRTPAQQVAYEKKLLKNKERKRAKKMAQQQTVQALFDAEDRNNDDGVQSDNNDE